MTASPYHPQRELVLVRFLLRQHRFRHRSAGLTAAASTAEKWGVPFLNVTEDVGTFLCKMGDAR
jgi:hypothetical protein